MRTRTTVAIAVAAGIVGAGAVGVPAVLAADDDPRPRDGFGGPMWSGDGDRGGWLRGGGMGGMMGRGMRGGPGGMGVMAGAGALCDRLDGEPTGELTGAQEEALADFAEREKLAQDLYTAFADANDDSRFAHLARAESHHLRALQAMMDRYGIEDPTDGNAAGEFTDEGVAADYEALLEDGSGSLEAALDVARGLEQDDVDRLGAAADELEDSASDVALVYQHLAFASERHLDVLDE